MATRIRLKRMGRRNRPFYRVVVMDSRKRRDGASIEEIGWYDPIKEENNFSLKEDRVLHWLKHGAQPTETVRSLMKRSGLAFRWHLMRRGLDEKTIDHELQKWALDREERAKAKAEQEVRKAEEEAKAKAVSGAETVRELAEEAKVVETEAGEVAEETVQAGEAQEVGEIEQVGATGGVEVQSEVEPELSEEVSAGRQEAETGEQAEVATEEESGEQEQGEAAQNTEKDD